MSRRTSKEDRMDTWGRRGFAAAVITGGMIGLSGAGTGGVPSAQWGGVPEQEPRTPPRPPTGPATRYGAPEYQPEQRVAEYRPLDAAEQTVATETVATQAVAAQAQPEQAMPRHATPSYAAAPVTGEYAAAEYPTGGIPRMPAGAGTHGVHGSDGFLAGNLAALASPPSVPAAGTPIGALGPAEGSLGTGFTSYGNTAAPAEFGRQESRHARPEQPERYADHPLESYGDRYSERRAESYGERPAESFGERPLGSYGERPVELYADRPAELYGERGAERSAEPYGDRGAELYGERPVELYGDHGAELYGERSLHTESQTVAMTPRSPIHSMGQAAVPAGQSMHQAPVHQQMGLPTSYPAERPVRAVELVGAAYQQGGNRHAQPVDSDTSALGSLDSSGLFGSLSRPPR
jgi:hypothetical protein